MGSKTFINRSKELESLSSHWRTWVEAKPALTEVWALHGPSGIGRSSLLDQWLASVQEEVDRVEVSFLEGPLVLQILEPQSISSVPRMLKLWQERLSQVPQG
ncbi:MAG: hypothetical protein R3257_04530, partial [bacterium]|nr:hypothetical protein [bacterium]